MTRKARTLAVFAAALATAAPADGPQGEPPPPPPDCPPAKVCVVEPRHATKVVYASRRKDYCLPCCSLWDLIFGHRGDCEGGTCGPVRTKNVLVKKQVPARDTKQCVVKELPCEPPAPAPPKP